jgi:hypothetical protein
MSNVQIFYVYEHWRLDRDECFYVGKGKGGRAYVRSGRNIHWKNIVSKLERIGSGYEIKIVQSGLSEKTAFALEHERVAFWKNKSDLCNKTDGGDGILGFVMPEESRRIMSEKAKARPGVKSMLGRKHSSETKLKMAASHKGKKKSPEHLANIGKALKNRTVKHSLETKLKMSQTRKGVRLSDSHRAAIKRSWDQRKMPQSAFEDGDR